MQSKSADAENIRWDLSVFYSGIDDPQINTDIAELTKRAKGFNIRYKGNLASKLGDAINDYEEITMLENKILVFFFLIRSANLNDSFAKTKAAEAERTVNQVIGEYLVFFKLELVALDDAVLEQLYAEDIVVARYRPWINKERLFKPHVLSEPVEASLAKREQFSDNAWSEFFNELSADIEFDWRENKKTLTEMLNILTESKDAQERAEIMQLINFDLGKTFAKYSAQTLYVVAGLKAVDDKERNYRNPMDLRNKSNQVPDAVVDTLHKAVNEVAGPLARRYYLLKAKHLGLEKLRWSDRNAPMPFADTAIIPFDEAMTTVISAYESFSPTLANIIRKLVLAKTIDVPAIKGKRGGAFNYSLILPNNKPVSFVFLNYLGSNRDVMTLAHELGHAVHGILAGKAQGALMFHTPIAYAETASVFGEAITFNFLKERLLAKGGTTSLLALTMGKIDDMINTTVRQIGFSNFERRLHGMNVSLTRWEEPRKLSAEELDAIWLETVKPLYGEDGDIFTYENAEHLWSYVNHFHRPFYVYGYAFGELLTHGLYAQQSRLGAQFEPLYLELLRSGSIKNVIELLKPFGLDPTSEIFWANGIAIGLGAMVEEAENLSRALGVNI